MTQTAPELPDLSDALNADPDAPRVSIPRDNIRQLEAAAKAGLQANKTAESAQRELAFYKAGIDPSQGQMAYFAKGYEGELTPEAIKAAATEAGFLQPQAGQPQAPGTPEPGSSEAAELRASAIAGPGAGAAPDVSAEAMKEGLRQAFKEGGQPALLAKCREYGIPIAGEQ